MQSEPGTAAATSPSSSSDQHTEHEQVGWTINIPDHAERTDSPAFVAARSFAQKIMATLKTAPYGPGPWQMHHGGSLWTFDDQGWFLVINTLGAEWSAQFCADPAKMELARQNALRHYAAFPRTLPQMAAMGYQAGQTILNHPIATADDVAVWVDSVFNSCVPLAASVHVGEVSQQAPYGGYHHYPKPIADIQFFKHDDFTLWVTDPQSGQTAAVTPAGPRGSGDGRVVVAFSAPGTALHAQHVAAHNAGRQLVLPADSPLAVQAFARQTAAPATPLSAG
ncbi:MAG TPA: DUF6424 family protein [Chloroflexota bacterium]